MSSHPQTQRTETGSNPKASQGNVEGGNPRRPDKNTQRTEKGSNPTASGGNPMGGKTQRKPTAPRRRNNKQLRKKAANKPKADPADPNATVPRSVDLVSDKGVKQPEIVGAPPIEVPLEAVVPNNNAPESPTHSSYVQHSVPRVELVCPESSDSRLKSAIPTHIQRDDGFDYGINWENSEIHESKNWYQLLLDTICRVSRNLLYYPKELVVYWILLTMSITIIEFLVTAVSQFGGSLLGHLSRLILYGNLSRNSVKLWDSVLCFKPAPFYYTNVAALLLLMDEFAQFIYENSLKRVFLFDPNVNDIVIGELRNIISIVLGVLIFLVSLFVSPFTAFVLISLKRVGVKVLVFYLRNPFNVACIWYFWRNARKLSFWRYHQFEDLGSFSRLVRDIHGPGADYDNLVVDFNNIKPSSTIRFIGSVPKACVTPRYRLKSDNLVHYVYDREVYKFGVYDLIPKSVVYITVGCVRLFYKVNVLYLQDDLFIYELNLVRSEFAVGKVKTARPINVDFYDVNLGVSKLVAPDSVTFFDDRINGVLELNYEQYDVFLQTRTVKHVVANTYELAYGKFEGSKYLGQMSHLFSKIMLEAYYPDHQLYIQYCRPGSVLPEPGRELVDLVGDTFVPLRDAATEITTLDGRLQSLREDSGDDDNVPLHYYEFMSDFVGELFPTPLTPYTLDDVMRSVPSKKRKFYYESCVTRTLDETDPRNKSFIKKEAYTEPKDARNISNVDVTHFLEYACYIRAIGDRLKDFQFYKFGKTPPEIAYDIGVLGQLEEESFTETDFGRFDGTQGRFCKQFEHAIIEACFPDEIDRVRELHSIMYYSLIRTISGIQYLPEFTRLSGSADTSSFNTLVNALTSYIALREQGHNHVQAMKLLCERAFFGGDDGLTGSCVKVTVLQHVVETLGMRIKPKVVPKGKPVSFLGRIYPDISSIDASFQDPVRLLKGLSYTDNNTISQEAAYIRKMVSYLFTERDNMIGRWASNYLTSVSDKQWNPVEYHWNPYFHELLEHDDKSVGEIMSMVDTYPKGYPSGVSENTIMEYMGEVGFTGEEISLFKKNCDTGSMCVVRFRDNDKVFSMLDKTDHVTYGVSAPTTKVDELKKKVLSNEAAKKLEREFRKEFVKRYPRDTTRADKPYLRVDGENIFTSTPEGKFCPKLETCSARTCRRLHAKFSDLCPKYCIGLPCPSRKCPKLHYLIGKNASMMFINRVLPCSAKFSNHFVCMERIMQHKDCKKLHPYDLCCEVGNDHIKSCAKVHINDRAHSVFIT